MQGRASSFSRDGCKRRIFPTPLSGANLRGANLKAATLSYAHLNEADMRHALLEMVNLNYATIAQTLFDEQALRHVRGLETIQQLERAFFGADLPENAAGTVFSPAIAPARVITREIAAGSLSTSIGCQ